MFLICAWRTHLHLLGLFTLTHRMMHKVQTEYGDACLNGVRAIIDGHLHPMNPNESPRNQIYLYNNIFFSRAVDTGLDTLKVSSLERDFLFFPMLL